MTDEQANEHTNAVADRLSGDRREPSFHQPFRKDPFYADPKAPHNEDKARHAFRVMNAMAEHDGPINMATAWHKSKIPDPAMGGHHGMKRDAAWAYLQQNDLIVQHGFDGGGSPTFLLSPKGRQHLKTAETAGYQEDAHERNAKKFEAMKARKQDAQHSQVRVPLPAEQKKLTTKTSSHLRAIIEDSLRQPPMTPPEGADKSHPAHHRSYAGIEIATRKNTEAARALANLGINVGSHYGGSYRIRLGKLNDAENHRLVNALRADGWHAFPYHAPD